MSVRPLAFSTPFFEVKYVEGEAEYLVGPRSVVVNLSSRSIMVRHQKLGFFQSTTLVDCGIAGVDRCLVIENHGRYDDDLEALYARLREAWTLVFDATGLERHKGVLLYRSAKEKLGDTEVNFCFADSVPLNVGLHQTHWGERPIREVHTQITGFGKMQQFRERDPATLYREDAMAPGVSHPPMYDDDCIYPWHQYETTTKGIFLATERRAS